MATKIIISVSEECTFQIKTYVGEHMSVANVEFCAIKEQVIDNCPWIRETLLTDVRSFDDRYSGAELISDMVDLFNNQQDDGISQVIYHKDGPAEYEKIIASEKIVVSTPRGHEYLCLYENNVVLLDRTAYPSPNTDVSHLVKNYEFHSNKHTANPMTFSPDNLINKSDMVVFVGGVTAEYLSTFEQHNELGNDHCIVHSLDEYKEKVLALEDDDDEEKLFRCVLVVNTFSVELALEVINERPEKIGCVVCETLCVGDKDARMILSTCHAKGIACVRKAQRHGLFNFGVVDHQCRDSFHTGNGVVTMTNNTVIDEYLYVIYIDPRMAQIARTVLALEMAVEVWCITLVHDAYDHVVTEHHDYKFFPVFQTEGFHRIAQMTHKHSMHTVIATLSPFPQIASLLFGNGIFATCEKECLVEYVDKVNGVFDNHVKELRKQNVSRIVDLKAQAYNTVSNIEKKAKQINSEIGPAVDRRNKRLVNNEVKTRRVYEDKKLLIAELQALKIN